MVLIVFHHYAVHGFGVIPLSFNKYLLDAIGFGGELGASVFILISSYFMIDSKFTKEKFIKIVLSIVFYATVFVIIAAFFIPLSFTSVIKSYYYWFAVYYLLLMLLSNYLNRFIKNLTKEDFKRLILIVGVCTYLLNYFLKLSRLSCFILLYFIAAYIKRFVQFDRKKIRINNGIVLPASLLVIIGSTVLLNFIGDKCHIPWLIENSTILTNIDSVFVLISAVSLFLCFLHLKINSKAINTIAKCTFGVYLIHDNFLARTLLWEGVFQNRKWIDSPYLILHALLSVFAVYVVATIIEYCRLNFLEKNFLRLIFKQK